MKPSNGCAVVGVGYTSQGRVPGRTMLSFHVEAAAQAIADAGLTGKDIDGLICYRHFPAATGEPDVTPYLVAEHLGISPTYLSQEANCARSHLLHAIAALEAGECNYVVISYGHNALSSDSILKLLYQKGSEEMVFGHFGATADYALAARRAMHLFGTGPETWKHIAVGQRKWANLNPRAMHHGRPMTFDDYFNSRLVVEPFRLFDNCLITDGGRACVVTTVERARDLPHRPVRIMGFGHHHPSSGVQRARHLAGPTGAKRAGERALRMAGVALSDIDACEIYDCFTYTVEITLQDLGFFGPGEGADWFAGGRIEPGGAMPVNTSGGLLSESYQMGLTPVTEAVMQLMGRCGDRQMGPATRTKEPEVILCTDNGGTLQSCACYVFGRE
ncbi:MAG: thiolase family protein [Deltaproteobacteria bacterium]|nr:thiolase family protein [Deltaproteobacteria bacterium]